MTYYKQIHPEIYRPKLQELVKITGVNIETNDGFDHAMALGEVLTGALTNLMTRVEEEIFPKRVDVNMVNQQVELAGGLKKFVQEHARVTLEQIDIPPKADDSMDLMILRKKRPTYELVSELLSQ